MNERDISLFGAPKKVKFCKVCVISNQRPSSTVEFLNANSQKSTIAFDDEGICDACNFSIQKEQTDWEEREGQLHRFFDKYRRKDGTYDCVVPSSGGKDSSFTAHILKNKYGMNPISVTWAPNLFTEVGYSNFQNLINIGGIDNILYTPNGRIHRLLTKLAFQNIGHPFQPFIHGQKIIGPRIAKALGIPLVVYGENQAEYGNPISENNDFKMNSKYYVLRNPEEMILGGMKIRDIMKIHNLNLSDFSAYLPLNESELKGQEISVIHLGYFERWDPQECYYYAFENTGFKPAQLRSDGTYSRYTEIDDKLVPFHFYTTFIKYGIGRATYDASQEIRNRKISREEGIALVKKYDSEFPSTYFVDFLDYLEISSNEFEATIDKFRSPHLWRKIKKNWELKHAVWH